MHILTQLGIGLIPACLGIIVIILLKKRVRVIPVLFAVLLSVCVMGTAIYGFGLDRASVSKTAAIHEMGQQESLDLAYALLAAGKASEAKEQIEEYSALYGYDDSCALLMARMAAYSGDLRKARGAYKVLDEKGALTEAAREEMALLEHSDLSRVEDWTNARYIEECGYDAYDYGISDSDEIVFTMADEGSTQDSGIINRSESRIVTWSEIQGTVLENIEEEFVDPQNLDGSADLILRAERLYTAYREQAAQYGSYIAPEDAGIDQQEIIALSEAFERLRLENKDCFDLPSFRSARLKILALNGDYTGIASSLDENASAEEWMVAAELYMMGILDESQFSETFKGISPAAKNRMINLLDEIEKRSEGLSKIDKRKLEDRIAAIRRELEDPALSEIKGKLTEYADSGRGDVSKEEMEIARIQYYFENDESVDSHINNAIQTSQDSDDGEYAYAMAELVQAMSNDPGQDKEKIKEVPSIVNNVTEHILPVDLPDEGGGADYSADYDDYDEKSSGEPQDGSGRGSFEDSVITTVNRNMTAITIGRIDTEAFPEITANAQIASSYADDIETLKSNLELADCDCIIDEFDLEKIEYSGARVILCCDISGSMQNSIGALKEAVKKFVSDREANEYIKIVTFDDTIKGESEFETDESELYSFADGMFAQGGTNMYSAVLECMDMFPNDPNSNNIIILMSDGEDNNPASSTDIDIELGGKADASNVSVYSIGLGESVDSNYLDAIADSGGGSFVYASDGGALDSLYELLHGQINDQYRLRYTARDTMRLTNRPMKLSFTDGTKSDIKYYSIGTDGAVDPSGKRLGITGVIPGRVYRGKQDIQGKLLGYGFSENKNGKIKLKGRLSYSLDLVYQDENTMLFTIPWDITCDIYDAEITIDNDTGYITRAITVIDETKLTRTEFGPYVFTSMFKNTQRGVTTLDGAVTMNDWLQYNGKITLTGDLKNDNEILVHDGDGAQIFYDPNDSEGLAKTLAEQGLHIGIPAFNDFHLYKDMKHMNSDDYEEYMVDFVTPGTLWITNLFLISQGDVAIYPDHYRLRFTVAKLDLPDKDKVMSFLNGEKKKGKKASKNTEDEKGEIDFGVTFEGLAGAKNLGFILDINTEYSKKIKDKKEKQATARASSGKKKTVKKPGKKLVSATKKNTYVSTAELEKNLNQGVAFDFSLMLNTYDWDVDVEIAVKMAMWPAKLGGGFSFEGGKWSELFFVFDRKILGPLGTIPNAVTYSEFTAALKGDLTAVMRDCNFSDVQLEGSFDAEIGKVSSVFPKLEEFIGDVSLLKFDDTTISLGLKDGRFSAYGGTSVKLLGSIDVAKVDVNVGRFTFDNYLLKKYGRKTDGIQVKVKAGIMYSPSDMVDVDVSGTGEIDSHTLFVGVDVSGQARVNFHWWWINLNHQCDGEFVMGFYKRDNNDMAFGIGLRGNNGGKTFVKHYYYDFNGESNLGNGQLT